MDFLRLSSVIGMIALACGTGLPHSQPKHDVELHPPKFGNCPSPISGPTINNLLDPDNNGVERLVIFVYRQSGTEDVLVFTPSKEYQHCIQDFPHYAGKFNQHYGSHPIKEMFAHSLGKLNPTGEKHTEDTPKQSDESNKFIIIMDNQLSEPSDFHQSPSKAKYLQKPGKAISGYPWDFFPSIQNEKGNSLDLQHLEEVDDVPGYSITWDSYQSPNSGQGNGLHEHDFDASGYLEKNTSTGDDEDTPSWQIPLEQYPTNSFPGGSFEHRNNYENELPIPQNINADIVHHQKDKILYDFGKESSHEYSMSLESYESGELSYFPAKGLHVSEDNNIWNHGHTHSDLNSHHSESESHQISEESSKAYNYQSHKYPYSYSVEDDTNRYIPDYYGNSEENVNTGDNDASNEDSGYIQYLEHESYETSHNNLEAHVAGNSASKEEETTKSFDESSDSEYESKPWPAYSHLNQHPWVQKELGGNVADHWIQVPRGKKQGKQNALFWMQVPSITSQSSEGGYWGSDSKKNPSLPQNKPVHTSSYHQNYINDGTVNFNQWFKKQLEVIKNGGTKIPTNAADINTVRGAIETTLRNNGLRVISPGTLQDENGKISKFSNLKLRPFLIGRSVPYNHFVQASSTYNIPAKTPFLEGLLVTMLNPPKVLGIVPLGITALSPKLSPTGEKVVITEGRKLNPNTQRILTGILAKRPGAYGTHGAVSETAPLTDSSTSGLKEMWLSFSDVLKKDDAVIGRTKLDGDGDLDISGEEKDNDDDNDDNIVDDKTIRNSEEEVTPGFRIIGGSSATGTGTPLASKGRSGFEKPFHTNIGML